MQPTDQSYEREKHKTQEKRERVMDEEVKVALEQKLLMALLRSLF